MAIIAEHAQMTVTLLSDQAFTVSTHATSRIRQGFKP
jgi:hypothetical protein